MATRERLIRVLRAHDIDAVVAIDAAASHDERRAYYEHKFDTILHPRHNINTSIVCEIDGSVAGFLMGDIYTGEYGIPQASATIDTLGVHPDFQHHGVGADMLDQFMMNMKAAGVDRVYTLVNWDDFALERFFSRRGFAPSRRINLEYRLP